MNNEAVSCHAEQSPGAERLSCVCKMQNSPLNPRIDERNEREILRHNGTETINSNTMAERCDIKLVNLVGLCRDAPVSASTCCFAYLFLFLRDVNSISLPRSLTHTEERWREFIRFRFRFFFTFELCEWRKHSTLIVIISVSSSGSSDIEYKSRWEHLREKVKTNFPSHRRDVLRQGNWLLWYDVDVNYSEFVCLLERLISIWDWVKIQFRLNHLSLSLLCSLVHQKKVIKNAIG